MLLSRHELYALTGYKYPKRQCLWLQRHGFRFATAATVLGQQARAANTATVNTDALQELL